MSQQKEIEKLKAENAKLKSENNRMKKQISSRKKSRRGVGGFRSAAVIILVSAAVALLTVANLLFWVGNTVVKQDRYVAATKPIIKDPAVQSAMALYTTNQIFSNIDVQKVTEQVLPPRADFLAPQLTAQLKTFTKTSLQKALANPKLQAKWNQVQAKQHDRLISFATKYQGDGDISVNDVFQQLTASLDNTKLAFLAGKQLPAKVGDVKVISAPLLPTFHNIVTHIDLWRSIAVILLLITVAAAVWLSRNRRRTIYIFSAFSAVFMLATLLALHITRETIVNKVDPQYAEGVRHILQIVFHSLVLQTITIMAAVIFVGAVAWVSGPARSAAALKRQVALLFSGKLHQSIFGQGSGWTGWVQRHSRVLEWACVAVLGAVMLFVRLTLKSLFIYILVLILLVLAIEVIGGPGTKTSKPAGSR